MPRPRRDHRHIHSQTRQLDLFGPPCADGPPAPAWSALPETIRRRATSLMVRLLLEHGRDDRRPGSAGGDSDV
jgi:hypothetical protein